jgi:hypothetical protein
MIKRIPISERRNSNSAICSSFVLLLFFKERMDAKENRQDAASSTATIAVNSSISVFSAPLPI